MDPILALSLLVMTLVLWTYIPQAQRHALSAGFGPAVHAVAEAVRAIVRPPLRLSYRLLCGLFGIEPAPWAVNNSGGLPANVLSNEDEDDRSALPRSAAFTNTGTSGSSAFTRDGTERTPEPATNAGVLAGRLELTADDLSVIIDSLERRGYLCLSPREQEMARALVYQTERRVRFDPAGQRSKTDAIKDGTGLSRGGSADYRRVSTLYDALIGQPQPAVVKPREEAATAQHQTA